MCIPRIAPLIAGALLAVSGCAAGPKTTVTDAPVTAAAPAPDISGRWEGVDDKGVRGAFILRPDHGAIMDVGGQRLGDPATSNGKALLWELDDKARPMRLDFVVIDAASKVEAARMMGIVELIDATHIKMRTFFNDKRPESWEGASAEDTITLERVGPAE